MRLLGGVESKMARGGGSGRREGREEGIRGEEIKKAIRRLKNGKAIRG